MVEQSFWQEMQPMENLCWSNPFLKDCTLPTLEQFKDLQPVARNHAGAGRKEQQRLPWTEQNLHSPSPCTPCSERGRRVKIEVEPGKRSCIFSFVFFSHYLNLLVINNELNCSSPSQDVLLMMAIAEWSLHPHLNPQDFSSYFIPVLCWVWSVREQLAGHLLARQD